MEVDPLSAFAALDIEPLELNDDEIVTGVIVIARTDSPEGLPGLAWVVSRGINHWERLGMLTDALDTARAEGQEPT